MDVTSSFSVNIRTKIGGSTKVSVKRTVSTNISTWSTSITVRASISKKEDIRSEDVTITKKRKIDGMCLESSAKRRKIATPVETPAKTAKKNNGDKSIPLKQEVKTTKNTIEKKGNIVVDDSTAKTKIAPAVVTDNRSNKRKLTPPSETSTKAVETTKEDKTKSSKSKKMRDEPCCSACTFAEANGGIAKTKSLVGIEEFKEYIAQRKNVLKANKLVRMEAAVQEWNACFGTSYTLFSNKE